MEDPKVTTDPQDECGSRLLALVRQITQRETAVLNCQKQLSREEQSLAAAKARLVATGSLTGSNETARKIQLEEFTITERAAVTRAEWDLAEARINLGTAQNEFCAWRWIARMLGGAE